MRFVCSAIAMCSMLMLGGCATSDKGAPELDSNLTYDGLAKVKNPKVSSAWMRPDFSLAGYTKIMLVGAGIEYRPVKPVSRAAASNEGALSVPRSAETVWRSMRRHGSRV